jgi:hypothetical protein
MNLQPEVNDWLPGAVPKATYWTPLTLHCFIQNTASILLAVMVANDDISPSDCA